MFEKKIDSSSDITVLVYYNESIIQHTDQGMILMSSEQAYFSNLQTILFEELNVKLCESINVGTRKRVVKIRYKCPISIVNKNIKYQQLE